MHQFLKWHQNATPKAMIKYQTTSFALKLASFFPSLIDQFSRELVLRQEKSVLQLPELSFKNNHLTCSPLLNLFEKISQIFVCNNFCKLEFSFLKRKAEASLFLHSLQLEQLFRLRLAKLYFKDWFIKNRTRTVVTLVLCWFDLLWISL